MSDDATARGGPSATVETVVVADRGRWAVELVVITADAVTRRRINTYRSERQAQIAAGWIRRGADRDIATPPQPLRHDPQEDDHHG